jgi:hypothetical protein
MLDPTNQKAWPGRKSFHWYEEDWRKFIIADDAPELLYWGQGSALPEVKQLNHLARPHKRVVQRLIHAVGLPVLDRLRARYSDIDRPQSIAPEVQQELLVAMKDLP